MDQERWWDKDETETVELAKAVFQAVDGITNFQQGARRKRNCDFIGLYENRKPTNYGTDGQPSWTNPTTYEMGDLTFNLPSACVDTLEGKIGPIKPRPFFVTIDGSLEEQLQAKGLQRFTIGSFLGGGAFREGQRAGKDAKICDIGAVKLVPDGKGHVGYQRVHPNDILVDEEGARNGKTDELFHRDWIACDVLCARFPDKEEQIKASLQKAPNSSGSLTSFVEVAEGWHLPTAKKDESAKPNGRRVLCIRTEVLEVEEWTDDTFPFGFIRWNERSQGFFGIGLVEALEPKQRELNEISAKISDGHALLGVPWVTKGPGSDVKQGAITNEIGEVIESAGGQPVEVRVHQIMAPEVYAYRQRLIDDGFEEAGISQLSAMSKKPAGVESGVALRTLLDAETTRFGMWVEAWQNFFLDLARETIKCARRMGNACAFYKERDWAFKIDFKEVDLSDDRYHLQLWPTALLPETPTGKLATVEQMITIGLINPDQGMSLLDFPDLEAFQRWNLAAKDNAEMIIENILRKGEEGYIAPNKFMNLKLSIQLMQSALLRGQIQGWPRDRLMLLERWCNEAAGLPEMQMAMPPPMPQPPAGGPAMAPPPPEPGPAPIIGGPPEMQPPGPMPA